MNLVLIVFFFSIVIIISFVLFQSLICTSCGTILGPVTVVTRISDKAHLTESKETCRLCGHGNNVSKIEIPYIFRFLVTQLASVNINVKIKCNNQSQKKTEKNS